MLKILIFLNILLKIYASTLSVNVFPTIVNSNGDYQTNNISEFNQYISNNSIHYCIDFHNETLLIDLNIIIGPVECHYTGKIRNEPDSIVSLLICNGLKGAFYFKQNIYGIEQVNKSNGSHSIYLIKMNTTHSFFKQVYQTMIHRSKRSISKERYVETLVVADKAMYDHFQYEDLETYLLTVMNNVNSLFNHASLENVVNIVVVRIIILENEESLKIETNATSLLNNFCKFQKSINYPQWHAEHHDYAILVTKNDICVDSNEPCDTLGLARLGGICNPDLSCSVNEDNGLSLSLTIAHEIGHSFNADHNTGHCEVSEQAYIMDSHLNLNSHLTSNTEAFTWSSCSSKAITTFLDKQNITCLNDDKHVKIQLDSSLMPGLSYDFDHQCQFAFGHNATHCKHKNRQCSELWCTLNGDDSCVTKSEKAAEGTLCGHDLNHWCIDGECVPIEIGKAKINGEWGEWSRWSNCSRECNGGIQFIERDCNNPPPLNKGKYCLGERKHYRVCNTKPCNNEDYDIEFKNKQCSKYSEKSLMNHQSIWEFHLFETDPCRLYCSPKGDSYFERVGELAENGTPCSKDSNSLCIDGICEKFGCDWVKGSTTKIDFCGKCGGNNSTCNILTGTVNLSTFKQGGYEPILLLPVNATKVKISKKFTVTDSNYLAVRNLKGDFYLNGGYRIFSTGSYRLTKDLKFNYVLNPHEESITFTKPLNENLYIMMLNYQQNSKISYEYSLPNGFENKVRLFYYWHFNGEWSICSKSCGKGIKRKEAACFELNLGKVDNSFCSADVKPKTQYQFCNIFECKPEWFIGKWQRCEGSCIHGGIKKRSIFCIVSKPNRFNDKLEIIGLPDTSCRSYLRPHDLETCKLDLNECLYESGSKKTNSNIERPHWVASEWTNNCEKEVCGIETRVVFCSDFNAICDPIKRPISEKKCSVPDYIKCGTWKIEKWSECSYSCPNGIRYRNVTCHHGFVCNERIKPHSEEICINEKCPTTFNDSTQNGTSFDFEDLNSTQNSSFLLNDYRIYKRSLTDTYLFDQVYNSTLFVDKNLTNNLLDLYNSTTENEFEWIVGSFGACTKKCETGTRFRKVICQSQSNYEQVNDDKCLLKKPVEYEECNHEKCLEWNVTEWSSCSEQCGKGFRIREAFCAQTNKCNLDKYPIIKETCMVKSCCEWVTEEWSTCSRTCGLGLRTRTVYCLNQVKNSLSDKCDPYTRPEIIEKCIVLHECPTTALPINIHCLDMFSDDLCKKVLYSNRCGEKRFMKQCCQTCTKKS